MNLSPGLNMISVPLDPVVQYTAKSLAEEIGATAVINYDTTLGKFLGFTPAASGDGFAINGGEGCIVNVPAGGTIAFTRAAWANEPPVVAAPPAQTGSAWAFVVSGSVLDGNLMSDSDGGYKAVVKNLRTGEMFMESVDPSGYFAAAWADLNRRAVIGAGDKVEVAVVDSSGGIVSGPSVHEVTLDTIRDAVVNGVTGGKLRYDAIAMLLARIISLFIFCPGTFPGIRQFLAFKSENCGGKLPILPLLGNLEIGMNRIFHNWEALPYLNSGAYRIISQLPSLYPCKEHDKRVDAIIKNPGLLAAYSDRDPLSGMLLAFKAERKLTQRMMKWT